jgi:hypothetical protein
MGFISMRALERRRLYVHDGMATSPGYNAVFISEGVHIFLFRSHLKSNSIRNLTDSYDAACPLRGALCG